MSVKKTICLILILTFVIFIFMSCGGSADNKNKDKDNKELGDILKKYRDDGMLSWWEIVAVYNAGENPIDYTGFDEILASLEGTSNVKMASYVTVANISVIIGADNGYFIKYDEYKSKLKNLLENPTEEYSLNDYIFGYYALKCSGTEFNQSFVMNYLIQNQKPDGGFALSGDGGDVDVTAFAVMALCLMYKNDNADISPLDNAVKFLEDKMSENGVFSSYTNENANSTACALSALICCAYGINSDDRDLTGLTDLINKTAKGLDYFKVKEKKEVGYSYLKNGKSDILATAQSAVALSDLENKTSVWEKLYLESLEAFKPEE